MSIKRLSISVTVSLLLLGTGATSIQPLSHTAEPIISAKVIKRHRKRYHELRHISYRQAKRYRNHLIKKAHREIKYNDAHYRYWDRKFHHEDKILGPIYYQNNPHERHVSHLDNYYYGKAMYYLNPEGDWSDILYGIKRLPLRPQSSRRIIRRLARYGDSQKHNGEYLNYLSFCHTYHSKPKYHKKQWEKQYVIFIYAQ